jgi:hypothetical protein
MVATGVCVAKYVSGRPDDYAKHLANINAFFATNGVVRLGAAGWKRQV